jgi:hypothetical protein
MRKAEVEVKPLSWAEIAFEKDSLPMADSCKMTEVFEKRHVDELVEAIPQNRGMEVCAEFQASHSAAKDARSGPST